jgi:hypothetical protein
MTTKLAEKAAGNAMSRLTFKQSIKDRPKKSRYFRILLGSPMQEDTQKRRGRIWRPAL